MRKMYFIISITLILVVIWAILFHEEGDQKTTILNAENGVLDLSDWSFKEEGSVKLGGTWLYYPNQFYTLNDLESGQTVMPESFNMPHILRENPLHSHSHYGTLVLHVTLPQNCGTLGLQSDLIFSAYKLYINHTYQLSVGEVSTLKEDYEPYVKLTHAFFHPVQKKITIIYQVADFDFLYNAAKPPILGLSGTIYRRSILGVGRDLFFFGIIFIMSLHHLGLFFLRRQDNLETLFFGIFSLFFGIRILIVGERFLPAEIVLPFVIYAKFAYLSVIVGFLSLFGFLYYAIPDLLSPSIYKLNNRIMTLAGLAILVIPMSFSDYILMVISLWGFIILIYAVIKMIQGIFKEKPYAISVFIGLFFLGLAMINDLIHQYTMRPMPSMIPLGLALFCFIESHTMAKKYIESHLRSEQLDRENKQFLSEIIQMNRQLEENVESRTKALKSALLEVEKLSITDYLTGLPNRRSMMKHLNQYVETEASFYIAILDIDHFKLINDTYGHNIGDQVLVKLSNLMEQHLNQMGIVGRWGGEEFLMIASFANDQEAFTFFDRLRQKIGDENYEHLKSPLTVTIGFTHYVKGASLDHTIATADEALYQGKNKGRNICTYQAFLSEL